MIQSYFKIAWRNLTKHRVFTIVNILGLSIGIIACLLILQFVRYEQNYDKISPNTPQLWRAYNETVSNGEVITQDGNTHPILGPSLKADLPEIKDFFRMYNRNTNDVVFYRNNQPIRIKHAWMTDPGFLRIFPQKFIAGNSETCLLEPWKIILTKSTAHQLFPDENPMGKTLLIPGGPFTGTYAVEGIVEDPPQNTHLKFNALISYSTRYAKGHTDGWDSYWDYNYFQLTPEADPEKVRAQLDLYSEQFLKSAGIRLSMQPFESIHLHSDLTYEIEQNGSARTVYFLGFVAMLIFAIGCINYINMTTARSLERAKEIGLRKVVGARRGQLAGQFIVEGFLINIIAIILSLPVLQALLPIFGRFIGRPLAEQGFDAVFWMQAGGLFLAGMIVASSYPALVLTRLAPLKVLGGHTASAFMGRGSRGLFFRKALVVFQFSCSAALIFGLIVVNRQLNHLQNHDKGLSLEQIITLKMPEADWRQDSLNRLKTSSFKNQIAQLSGISSISSSSVVPSLGIQSIAGTSSGLVLANKPSQTIPGTIYFVDASYEFYETFGIRFLAGKPFITTDDQVGNQHVIINEVLLEILGIPSPEAAIGVELAYPGRSDGFKMRIEGVVANFQIESLKAPARPTLYFCQPEPRSGYISLKINPEQIQSLLASMELVWKNTFPESPFEYWFLDEHFAGQYAAETQLSKVFGLFAALAIFIACLGLFGLVKFSSEQRTKEIGIRKVLGASVSGIVALLSKEYTKLVFIAAVIAFPIAWWAMNSWLEEFAFRINIGWWVFLISGLSALFIALGTISYQAIKAAIANPVKSLRSE